MPAGSPTRRKVLERVLLVLPALLSFALYVLTLSRGIGLADGGELALVVKTLGVAHPPGFPVYVMLGRLASLVPSGTMAHRLSVFSALSGAAAVGGFTFLAHQVLGHTSIRPSSGRDGAPNKDESPPAPRLDRLIVAGAVGVTAMALGASVLVWSWSIPVEVYALNLALLLWALGCAARSARAGEGGRRALLGAAGLLAGLALGVHVVTAAFVVPALLVLTGLGWKKPAAYWPLLVGGILGTASYMYLPLAAAAHPLVNWGEPDTLGRFLRHVTGLSYASNVKVSSATAAHELVSFVALSFRQLSPVGLTLAGVGLVELWQHKRFAAYAVVAALVPIVVFGAVWIVPEDKDAYYLPALAVLALAAAAGLVVVGRQVIFSASERNRAAGAGLRTRAAAAGVVALVLVAGPSAALAAGPARLKARPTATVVARDALRDVAPDATFLVTSWDVFAPLWYFQNVEGVRPDVRIIGTKLLYWSWYYEMLRRQYPDLVAPCSAPVSQLLVDMKKYESGRAFDKQRLFRRLDEVTDGLIQVAARRGPVYYMPPFEPDTGAGYRPVPRGLAEQLLPWSEAPPPPEPPTLHALDLVRTTPGLGGSALRALYAQALTHHAAYALGFKKDGIAIDLLRRAIKVDPSYTNATRGLEAAQAGDHPSLEKPPNAPYPRQPCR